MAMKVRLQVIEEIHGEESDEDRLGTLDNFRVLSSLLEFGP